MTVASVSRWRWPSDESSARDRARWRSRRGPRCALPGRARGRGGLMRIAHNTETVRSAEHGLMATLPDGALMQRAAAGLASVCAGLLGSVYGARVVVLAGSGDNGADALYAGARLAGRGARVTVVQAGPRLHEQAAAQLAARGGRFVRVSTAQRNASPSGQQAASAAPAAIGAADLIIDGL